MIHIYDRTSAERALAADLDATLRALLVARIAALRTPYGDLTQWTEFLVIEPGDTEADIVRHVGFSPLIDPIDGYRWPDPRFVPGWDLLIDHGRCFELAVTFGSTFAYVLLIQNADTTSPLLRLCRASATETG